MKACISSVYFPNISREVVEWQRRVVNQFNISRHPFHQTCVSPTVGHGGAIDQFFERNYKELRYDPLLFLDIDCIPLCPAAIDYYLERAAAGVLIGNMQFSMHIDKGAHLFVAPSAFAISLETYEKIGHPSAQTTVRGDVTTEFTYRAETAHIPVEMTMPSRFDAPPSDGPWIRRDGPELGRGTTFTHPILGDLFWHNYQIWQLGQQENFIRKCHSVLEGPT